MFDIKWIRENPDDFDRAMARRGLEPQAEALLTLDAKRRELQTKAQEIQAERNRLSKEIGAAKSRGEDAAEIPQHRFDAGTLVPHMMIIPSLPLFSTQARLNSGNNAIRWVAGRQERGGPDGRRSGRTLLPCGA